MSIQLLIQELILKDDIDKSILIQIIHNLAERVDKLESQSYSKSIINIPPPKETYTEFIKYIKIPKIDEYLNNFPNLLIKIINDWLNQVNIPIILYKQKQLYIYITNWRLLVNNDLNNLYNYIIKQITIQLSSWQTKYQDKIIRSEKVYETYSTFISTILSNQPNKLNFIKENIKKILIIKSAS